MLPALEPPQRRFALLFLVMLMLYAGNTALQSIMPAVGRTLRLPDWLIALTFSLSAFVWATAAPIWMRYSHRVSGRAMILIGLIGFVVSQSMGGLVLAIGLQGLFGALATFFLFIAARLVYAILGSAGPSAIQAMVAEDTEGLTRTRAIAAIASAVGLGTIIGPALAPFFDLPVVGFGGSGLVFAGVGIVVLLIAMRHLPAGSPNVRMRLAEEPAIGGEPDIEMIAEARLDSGAVRLRWHDPRVRRWLTIGFVINHVQTAIGQIMGFLIIDRLAVSPAMAQPLIGLVLMAGAGAALISQWGIIPRFPITPRQLVVLGTLVGAIGTLGVGMATDIHGIAIGFALASLGFGLARPGFTAGASLAVDADEQASLAGLVTAVSGYSFVLAPAIAIFLYGLWRPMPYMVGGVSLAVLAFYGLNMLPGDKA